MRNKGSLVSMLAFTLAASPGWAAPATSDGAKAIAQGYAEWFSQAVVDKGLVSVTPQGDDYLVAWDLQRIVDLTKPAPDAVKVDKFSYVLTPTGDDAWTVKTDHFPSIAFNVATEKGKVAGTVDLSGFRLDTTYNGKLPQFLLSTLAATLMSAKIHVAEANGPSDVDLKEAGLAIETKAKSMEVGIDLSINQSIRNLTEIVTVAPGAKDSKETPVKVTFTAGAATSDATFAALRANEIGVLWKYAVAHGQDANPAPDMKAKVSAVLPLWNDFRANAAISDMTLDLPTPMMPIHAELKGLSETVALSGFTPHASAEIGVKLTDLSATMAMLPDWSKSVQPASLDIDLKVTVDGMDQVARLAIDDPNFGGKGDLTEETQEKIKTILMNGHPRLTISPGRFATPTLELTYEGEVIAEADQPTGHFTIGANGLDKTQALIQEIAKDMPDAQSALLVVAFIKGLATTGGDGRLVWKVEVNADGGVTVNGNPMPTGK